MDGNTKVMVVDDETALAAVIARCFRDGGYEVSVVHDGVIALDEARQTRPDLIVLDLVLPGIDGIEVCRRLREFSAAYVLVFTARDGAAAKIDALSAGADDYVVKPASPRELLARAAAMLRRPRVALPS